MSILLPPPRPGQTPPGRGENARRAHVDTTSHFSNKLFPSVFKHHVPQGRQYEGDEGGGASLWARVGLLRSHYSPIREGDVGDGHHSPVSYTLYASVVSSCPQSP